MNRFTDLKKNLVNSDNSVIISCYCTFSLSLSITPQHLLRLSPAPTPNHYSTLCSKSEAEKTLNSPVNPPQILLLCLRFFYLLQLSLTELHPLT